MIAYTSHTIVIEFAIIPFLLQTRILARSRFVNAFAMISIIRHAVIIFLAFVGFTQETLGVGGIRCENAFAFEAHTGHPRFEIFELFALLLETHILGYNGVVRKHTLRELLSDNLAVFVTLFTIAKEPFELPGITIVRALVVVTLLIPTPLLILTRTAFTWETLRL